MNGTDEFQQIDGGEMKLAVGIGAGPDDVVGTTRRDGDAGPVREGRAAMVLAPAGADTPTVSVQTATTTPSGRTR